MLANLCWLCAGAHQCVEELKAAAARQPPSFALFQRPSAHFVLLESEWLLPCCRWHSAAVFPRHVLFTLLAFTSHCLFLGLALYIYSVHACSHCHACIGVHQVCMSYVYAAFQGCYEKRVMG